MNIVAKPSRLDAYLRLMRVDRPIGTYLLLWPTLMALWLAAGGVPSGKLLLIFLVGTFLMRSAGCVINDYFDRDFDSHVKRTAQRPLTSGEVEPKEALYLFSGLIACAFGLVLLTNTQTILLSFVALSIAGLYPLMKRITQWPQFVLGVAFSFGIPMAFTAQMGTLPNYAWLLFAANIVWTIVYDTFYAMVDRDDDLRIGLKSTAILFGDDDRLITAMLQLLVIGLLLALAASVPLHWPFLISVLVSVGLFMHQQKLIAERQRDPCFVAFLNNHWVGLCWFIGIVLDFALINS